MGHEATDTGLAYAPVSQAHGHHHIVQCFFLAALQRRPVLNHSRWLLTVLWPGQWGNGGGGGGVREGRLGGGVQVGQFGVVGGMKQRILSYHMTPVTQAIGHSSNQC